MDDIDLNSDEFQVELKKTWKFINKTLDQFNFTLNPDSEINESIALGLTRNKLLYGKRYCPCFMVIGNTSEERKKLTIAYVHANQHWRARFYKWVIAIVEYFAQKSMLISSLKR